MQKAMVFTSLIWRIRICSNLVNLYSSTLCISYDGTSNGPFLFLERKDETAKLIWLVQYAYFYFLVAGLKVIPTILHSMRAKCTYFTVTKYFLTTSEHVLGFLTSLFKSEILTYREIFTRNEFSSLTFMFRLDKS